ncbi:hypothetical protein GQ457_17G009420 [Hibiscus cannabinus]
MRAFASHSTDFGANFKDNRVDGVRNCNALKEPERNKGETTKPKKRALKDQLALDPSGQSKGYGFVQFDNEESAKKNNRAFEWYAIE